MKILAVDDEKFNLLLLQTCLKGEKFEVKGFENPSDALDCFKKNDFDAILLDIMMKGIDGFEVRKLIRELNRDIPIIFLTSMVDDINSSLLNRIASDPYSYYMNKSFTKPVLMAKIHEVYSIYDTHKEVDTFYQHLEENMALAGEVQRVMLPTWCAITDDMLVSYLYSPGQQVSGDMLELVGANNKHLVFIGDIAGHGVQAALYMSAMQSFLKVLVMRSKLSGTELVPHEVLNALDSFLRNDLGGRNYMTCIVAIFDFKKNHLSYQNAGHPAIIRIKHNGEAALIDDGERGGLPVSFGPKREYIAADTIEVNFEDDEIFAFYTDGIMDLANGSGETAGIENTLQLLTGLVPESNPVAVPFRLRRAIEQIGFDKVNDDITVAIVTKRNLMPNRIYQVIHADTSAVSAGVGIFGKFIENKFNDSALAVKVELILSEFLNNTAVHGFESNQGIQSDVFVDVSYNKDTEDEISVRILDRGREWNYSEETAQASDAILEQQNAKHATSGRGMAIIHSIASRISRSHYFGLNETVMTIPVHEQPKANL